MPSVGEVLNVIEFELFDDVHRSVAVVGVEIDDANPVYLVSASKQLCCDRQTIEGAESPSRPILCMVEAASRRDGDLIVQGMHCGMV